MFTSCSCGKGVEHISRDDEEMCNSGVPSHSVAYDRPQSLCKPLSALKSATLKELTTSLSFPLQEALLLVWLNFCHWLAKRFFVATLRVLHWRQLGAEPAAAPRPVSLQRFGLSLYPPQLFYFIFLPGPKPRAVTATIVCCEVQSSILMKCRTSSAHFNCQQVSNGQLALQTPNRLCD